MKTGKECDGKKQNSFFLAFVDNKKKTTVKDRNF
jgi:hypothetical protein